MKHSRAAGAGGVLVLLLIGSPAWAEPINWSYSWSYLPENVQPGTAASYISLSNVSLTPVTGSSDVVAAEIQTHAPNVSSGSYDPNVKLDYALQMQIVDQQSGKTGTLTFQGEITGTLTSDSSVLQNTYIGPSTQALALGSNLYTIRLGDFSPPGPPTSGSSGSISARATVEVRSLIIQSVPEPSALLLGSLGFSILPLGCRRARRQRLLAVR